MSMILGVYVRHYAAPVPRETPVVAATRHKKHYQEGMGKLELLFDRMCWDAEIPVAAVRGRRKTKVIVAVRRNFAAKATRLGYSSPMIGAVLRRHHTSVLSLLARV